MTREEAIWWVNHLFEIRKEEYFNKGMMKDAKEVDEAQHMAIEALQADAEERHYIKIYADDEPSVKAEKLYLICGETQPKEVTEWLKEYFPALQESEIKTEQTETPTIQGKTPNFTEKHQLSEETSTPDLISRADAIKVFRNFCPNCGSFNGGEE